MPTIVQGAALISPSVEGRISSHGVPEGFPSHRAEWSARLARVGRPAPVSVHDRAPRSRSVTCAMTPPERFTGDKLPSSRKQAEAIARSTLASTYLPLASECPGCVRRGRNCERARGRGSADVRLRGRRQSLRTNRIARSSRPRTRHPLPGSGQRFQMLQS
jgi:hypothetical protein